MKTTSYVTTALAVFSMFAAAPRLTAASKNYHDPYEGKLKGSEFVQNSEDPEYFADEDGTKHTKRSLFCKIKDPQGNKRTYCVVYHTLDGSGTGAPADDILKKLNPNGDTLLYSHLFSADMVLAQTKSDVSEDQVKEKLKGTNYSLGENLHNGLYYINVKGNKNSAIKAALVELGGFTEVFAFVEPNYAGVQFDLNPTDPHFQNGDQWDMKQIKMPCAWGLTQGPSDNLNVVAVLDTGIDMTHEDLAANIFSNPNDPTGGGDNDGNGYIDDTHGWDFVAGNNNPSDQSGHGTLVAGIIGAVGNNSPTPLGIAGACWHAKLLSLRIIPTSGVVDFAKAASAINYINKLNTYANIKVTVANHSYGGTGFSTALFNAVYNNPTYVSAPGSTTGITASWSNLGCNLTMTASTTTPLDNVRKGMTVNCSGFLKTNSVVLDYTTTGTTRTLLISDPPLVTSASGKALVFGTTYPVLSTTTLHVAAVGDRNSNTDASPIYPACLPGNYVMSVGGTDKDGTGADILLANTDTGAMSTDIFAPGKDIWGPYWISGMTNQYNHLTGCSFAAPHVSGAAAMIRAQLSLSVTSARSTLIGSADAFTVGATTYGRLNICTALGL